MCDFNALTEHTLLLYFSGKTIKILVILIISRSSIDNLVRFFITRGQRLMLSLKIVLNKSSLKSNWNVIHITGRECSIKQTFNKFTPRVLVNITHDVKHQQKWRFFIMVKPITVKQFNISKKIYIYNSGYVSITAWLHLTNLKWYRICI